MNKMNKIDVIYLMAGVGKRADLKYPKQFYLLGGKPIFIHALEKLILLKPVAGIFIVCQKSMIEEIQRYIDNYKLERNKVIHLIEGGDTRQDSVFNALKFIITNEVVIMEGVRPFASMELITSVICSEFKNVVPINKSYASIYSCENKIIDRNTTGTVQLPQKFDYFKLKKAHEIAKKEGKKYNDDSDLMKDIFNPSFHVFYGPQENIKITTPFDLIIAEAIYNKIVNGGNDE